ncbi:MAG: hypothetical protein GY787_02570 [Alteromonadales bacterium]|nr:hypothetical protein [Alteromonadales bacterium]
MGFTLDAIKDRTFWDLYPLPLKSSTFNGNGYISPKSQCCSLKSQR